MHVSLASVSTTKRTLVMLINLYYKLVNYFRLKKRIKELRKADPFIYEE